MMAEHRSDRSHWNRNFFVNPFSNHQSTSSHPTPDHAPNLAPQNRHVGDGFDFRRPIMSQSVHNIIDLTDEPSSSSGQSPDASRRSASMRGNHARQNIIDLDDDDEQDTARVREERRRGNSPDLEVLFSRPLSAVTRPRSRSIATSAHGDRNARHISVEQAVADIRRDLTNRGLTNHGQVLGRLLRDINRQPRPNPNHHHHHHHHHHRHNTHSHLVANGDDLIYPGGNFDFTLPHQLDFERPGFNMGTAPQSQPPPPTYEPPAPPRPGFTRTPKEEDILVCPNCDEELGKGQDEVKRQVWIVKSCGHVKSYNCQPLIAVPLTDHQVYCGECATNRKASKKALRTTRAKPFARCQVKDCGQKPISHPSAMIQVYL